MTRNEPDKAIGDCEVVIQHGLGAEEKLRLDVDGRAAVTSRITFESSLVL